MYMYITNARMSARSEQRSVIHWDPSKDILDLVVRRYILSRVIRPQKTVHALPPPMPRSTSETIWGTGMSDSSCIPGSASRLCTSNQHSMNTDKYQRSIFADNRFFRIGAPSARSRSGKALRCLSTNRALFASPATADARRRRNGIHKRDTSMSKARPSYSSTEASSKAST